MENYSALKPELFDWDPQDVDDETIWEDLKMAGTKPESLPNQIDRKLYQEYLDKRKG